MSSGGRSLSWLEAKNGAGLTFGLAPDFDLALKVAGPGESRRRQLPLLAEAIRRDVHFIFVRAKDYPQGLFQCLWNTCWWYDCPDAAKHYDPPKDGWGEAGAPWDGQSPRLCELLERWQQVREHIRGVGPWVRSMRPPATPLGGNQRAVLRGHEDGVTSASFNRDGTRVVTASEDNTARVWDAASGRELAVLRGHEGWVNSAAFSPDGTRVVTASSDKTARVWDAQSVQEIAVLRGHEALVSSAVFNREGTRVVTASDDKTARVWDVASGACLAVLRGHEKPVKSAAFSPDGTRVVTASSDNTARVWNAATGACLEVITGTTDITAMVGGAEVYPWRAVAERLFTRIERPSDGAVAWYATSLDLIATHSAGRMWAGSLVSELHLITLEGTPPAGSRTTRPNPRPIT